MESLHWYCFAFFGCMHRRKGTKFCSVYVGRQQRSGIMKHEIDAAKDSVLMRRDATLLSVSYLGYMTRDEFETEGK